MATATKATSKTKVKPQAETPSITITKTGSCKTLNGKSKLEYALGKDATGKLHYRITKNDGGGHYSGAWVAAEAIQNALAKTDPITAYPLRAISPGSVNTAGFILAVLVGEGVVEQVPKKTRHYRYTIPNANRTAKPSASPAKPSASPVRKPTKPTKK